jgi:hypothetical protein
VQRRRGLRSDGRVASTGVGHTHTETHATHSIASGEVPEHGPRLHIRIEGWHKLGSTAILLLPQRTREQCVEMVRNPKRVDAVGKRIQVIGSCETLGRRAETTLKSITPTRNPVMREQGERKIQRGGSYSSIEASSPLSLAR